MMNFFSTMSLSKFTSSPTVNMRRIIPSEAKFSIPLELTIGEKKVPITRPPNIYPIMEGS
jgi:hypothetical protein